MSSQYYGFQGYPQQANQQIYSPQYGGYGQQMYGGMQGMINPYGGQAYSPYSMNAGYSPYNFGFNPYMGQQQMGGYGQQMYSPYQQQGGYSPYQGGYNPYQFGSNPYIPQQYQAPQEQAAPEPTGQVQSTPAAAPTAVTPFTPQGGSFRPAPAAAPDYTTPQGRTNTDQTLAPIYNRPGVQHMGNGQGTREVKANGNIVYTNGKVTGQNYQAPPAKPVASNNNVVKLNTKNYI